MEQTNHIAPLTLDSDLSKACCAESIDSEGCRERAPWH